MRLAAVFACAVMFALGVTPGHAEKRVALVIGNVDYKAMPALRNPVRDASEVEATLKRLGFTTTRLFNADARTLNDGFKRFAQSAAGAEAVFVFYSGHGAQLEGRTWLLPVDARLETKEDVNDADLLALDRILATLRDKSAVRIVVLDACRDNPVVDTLNFKIAEAQGFKNAPVSKGLGRPLTALGDLVVYATQAGAVAADGDGANSPFTESMLKHLETSDLDVRQMFFRVQEDVGRRFRQLPEVSNSIIGEFKLKIAAVQPSQPTTPGIDPCAAVSDHWRSAEAIGTLAAFEDHLARFPNCAFAGLARARIEELKKRVAAVAPPVQQATPPSPVQPAVGIFPSDGRTALSPEKERALKRGDTFKECDKCPEMVVVPAGSFTMGSPANEVGRRNDESPQHSVTMSKSFAVGRFAVTFDEWDACVAGGGCNGYKPADQGWGRGRRPVINVSWDDAKAYVTWLSSKTGKTYRLLSEAEREYVTRAGTSTPFWLGSSISTSQANYDGNYTYGSSSKGEYRKQTVPVDSFQPNAFGLYQVHGNVWEWVEDCAHDSYTGAPSDGSAWVSGDCSRRVLRGGSWDLIPRSLRAAHRFGFTAGSRDNSGGFRLARTP
jgi:formylglycine-generating enzyme required for sulfatase activity